MTQATNPRWQAALALRAVIEQQQSFNPHACHFSDPRDKALYQQLVFGALRHYPKIHALRKQLCPKPFHKSEVGFLIEIGLYQLLELNIKTYAIVNETINALAQPSLKWAKGVINAVLRRFIKEQQSHVQQLSDRDLCGHPSWWITQLRQDWPEQWSLIIEANNTQPPMIVRVNRDKISRDQYQEQLKAADIEVRTSSLATDALILEKPMAAEQLLGFADQLCCIQDSGAQCAVDLLQLKPEHHLLDACAAPGNKTTHCLIRQSQLQVTAIENNPHRFNYLQQQCERFGDRVQLIEQDIMAYAKDYDGSGFDRILCDAPCSGSGVVRRHPDIKFLKEAADLPLLAATQSEMLKALWPLVKPKGVLLYVTCSVFYQENDQVIQTFLSQQSDAKLDTFTLPSSDFSFATQYGWQLLPTSAEHDGFYYARLVK